MRKCQTDVFVSVFCDVRDSMGVLYNREWLRDNAVSLYFLELLHFTLVEKLKVFKDSVWNIYTAPRTLFIFIVLQIRYMQVYTMFFAILIHLSDLFHFFTISSQSGFQAYLPAKHYLAIFCNM